MPSLEQGASTVTAAAGAGLAPSDAAGGGIAFGCVLATAAALGLAGSGNLLLWLGGQVLLAFAFLQWFVLLHEAGHLTLFANRTANIVTGHVAGFFALIPFESWRRVHGLHHLWTGWQDLDPTTAPLVPRRLGTLERLAVDWAWKLWLPLFSILYRIGNYWRLGQLNAMFPARRPRVAMAANAVLLIALYVAIAAAAGAAELLWLVGPGLFLSLMLQDPLILSQHTHIPQKLSEGRAVTPMQAAEQERYTRSLRFPRWIAQPLLVNFNAHELHHRHVNVPGYRLARLERPTQNGVSWWLWLREAKRLRGSAFLFSNRDETGMRW